MNQQIISYFIASFILGTTNKIPLRSLWSMKESGWLSRCLLLISPLSVFCILSHFSSSLKKMYFSPVNLSLFPYPHPPRLFAAVCLAELAAVWPKSPATGTTLEGAGPSVRRPLMCVCVLACVFVCPCVRRCVRFSTHSHLMHAWPRQHDVDLTGWQAPC